MTKFLARYHPRIAAILSGFDRLVFRGTLLPLVRPNGMFCFLQRAHVGLLDFKEYVLATSERLSVRRSSTTAPSAISSPVPPTKRSSPAACSPSLPSRPG